MSCQLDLITDSTLSCDCLGCAGSLSPFHQLLRLRRRPQHNDDDDDELLLLLQTTTHASSVVAVAVLFQLFNLLIDMFVLLLHTCSGLFWSASVRRCRASVCAMIVFARSRLTLVLCHRSNVMTAVAVCMVTTSMFAAMANRRIVPY